MSEQIKIWFKLNGNPVAGETIWAEHTEENLYRLLNIPFYANGYALNDIVLCTKNDDGLEVLSLAKDRGNGTIRIFFQNLQEAQVEHVLNEFTSLGCDFERASPSLIAVSIPHDLEVPFSQVANYLNSLASKEMLAWEIGKRINRHALPD